MNSNETYDVIVIGAGQAGLATSYLLNKNDINHIVLERGTVADTWKKRWDSFYMNSPNKFNLLPGESIDDSQADGFISGQQYVEKLVHYAQLNQLPVQTQTTVVSLTKSTDDAFFKVTAQKDGQSHLLKAKAVVVATGGQNFPTIPAISKRLPASLFQIHSDQYRNPSQLPEGAVLIIGSATSGVQIAEDLTEAGRKVFMSTSAVARMPRHYRGLDIMEWLDRMQFFNKPTHIAEPHELQMKAPLMSGIGEKGHTLSLQSLNKQSVILLGYLEDIQDHKLTFKDNLVDNLQFGDMVSNQLKDGINQFIDATHTQAPVAEIDDADSPVDMSLFQDRTLQLDLKENNINAVIWTTGFTGNFNWINLPVLDAKGQPVHSNGISNVPNLYFNGLPWQRNLKSSLIFGIMEDTEIVTTALLQNLRVNLKEMA